MPPRHAAWAKALAAQRLIAIATTIETILRLLIAVLLRW
jgi:hypothetical protein